MKKHTVGPWEFIDNSLVGPKIDDKAVWLRPVIFRSATGISEEDARLIAAAPELLNALEAICFSNDSAWQSDCARAAITKAKGEQ